jgi:hypothetical protein
MRTSIRTGVRVYLLGECSYRRAAEEPDIQCRSCERLTASTVTTGRRVQSQ